MTTIDDSITLTKGETLSLTKVFPMSTKIQACLGWDKNSLDTGAKFDLDVSTFLLNAQQKIDTGKDFIFYNQPKGPGIFYHGDNTTGSGTGHDEKISYDLNLIPSDKMSIPIVVSIHCWKKRKQNFGQIRNAYICLEDEETGKELCRYDLTEEFSGETSLIFAEIYRYNDEWKFRTVGAGFNNGLSQLCAHFGLTIAEEVCES